MGGMVVMRRAGLDTGLRLLRVVCRTFYPPLPCSPLSESTRVSVSFHAAASPSL